MEYIWTESNSIKKSRGILDTVSRCPFFWRFTLKVDVLNRCCWCRILWSLVGEYIVSLIIFLVFFGVNFYYIIWWILSVPWNYINYNKTVMVLLTQSYSSVVCKKCGGIVILSCVKTIIICSKNTLTETSWTQVGIMRLGSTKLKTQGFAGWPRSFLFV